MNVLVPAGLTGLAATAVLDLWALSMARGIGIPVTNWAMVGRWLGHMPQGRFRHETMAAARSVAGEAAIGWGARYIIGAGYGLLLLCVAGAGWFARPTLLAPLLVSWTLLAAPFLLMMPGMGLGVAAWRTPEPAKARLRSLAGHSVFGLGLYGGAMALNAAEIIQ